jgi:hypothetical protein
MGSSLLLALTLSAWPLPRDAGASEYSEPSNWPNEPGWSIAWPLYSFTPAGWSLGDEERDAGVGMRVDRAWSITRGQPEVVLAIAATTQNLSDPIVAHAWRLSPGEFPDAGDLNGNGRLDVGDFAADPSVVDVNANGALDLEDLIAAKADGLDQDGNGRIDDLCGWDVSRHAAIVSARDAGVESWRTLAAPVGDGLPGIGLCPQCSLFPLVTSAATLPAALRLAADAGVKALLLPTDEGDLDAELELALGEVGRDTLLVTAGSGALATFPLALHPAVVSARTLTAPATRTTALDRSGCGGAALAASVSISTEGCSLEAATTLVGLAGLVFSAGPSVTPAQVTGLLGGARVDAERAVRLAEGALAVPITPSEKLRWGAITSAADVCSTEAGEIISCEGGLPRAALVPSLDVEPGAGFVRVIERQGAFEWSTALPSPHPDSLRGLLGVTELGTGSGPPRFVDIDGLGSEAVLASSAGRLIAFTDRVEVLTPAVVSGKFAPAIGDFNADRVLDVVSASDTTLLVSSFNEKPVAGFPRALPAPLAGPPLLTPTFEGTALVTLDVNGRLTHTLTSAEWTFELGEAQQSAPAAGRINGDDFADLAVANGRELRVLITDARGPTAASWSAPSRATQALLGNLVGDAKLEIVAERVFDASGEPLLTLEGWTVSVVPPALARLDESANRALLQVERRVDGLFELTRYDVQFALSQGDSLVERRVLRTLAHTPSRGGFVVADVTGDRLPDVLLPTEDGLLFIIDGEGDSPFESPLPTLGTVSGSPAIGVARDEPEFAVRTTRGDLVRWLSRGHVKDITWESVAHDRANTWNAETPLPVRRVSSLGITEPPILQQPCGCTSLGGSAALALVFLFRRRRRTC